MAALYEQNTKPENCVPCTVPKGSWGGGNARTQLLVIYTLAFCCLLRIDEVLKIQAHDIRYLDDSTIELTLPERKTDQYGGK